MWRYQPSLDSFSCSVELTSSFFFPSLQFYLLSFSHCFVAALFYWFARPSCKQTRSVHKHMHETGETYKKFTLNASKESFSSHGAQNTMLFITLFIYLNENTVFYVLNRSCLRLLQTVSLLTH